MSEVFLDPQQINNIFKSHITIETKVMSIETLFANLRMQNKIIYAPYYQRNYVWDNDKASYFIESILLGTEIPPLVFFNTGKYIEVIDGRQRFETIKRFIDKQFHLTSKGLYTLKELSKKNFDDLGDTKDLFWDTKLRIIEFKVINEPRLDERSEDLIKKEIFRRYNSGITPLRTEEINKAVFANNDTVSYFKSKLKTNKTDYETFLELFFLERDIELKEKSNTLEKVMEKIRLFLVLHNIPINYYATLKGRKDVVAKLFENLSNTAVTDNDVDCLYDEFFEKIYLIKNIHELFKLTNMQSNRLVYECLFWALCIMEEENIDINRFKEANIKESFIRFINDNIDKFNTENSHFYKEFNGRYSTIALFILNQFSINTEIYMSNNGQFRNAYNEIVSNHKERHNMTQLQDYRISKTDSSTTTIEDICRQMSRERFLVRPTYQRGESINKYKASSIIESILLGIKLPPIFVYKRKDGISEVVDGQQRLLAILGFIGQEFLDENFQRVKSDKNKYALSKLTILKDEIEGKKFEDLDDKLQDKIYEFNLSIVTIDAKVNPNFDPIDLFIRLNYKPYPIRENTFEMWNSYIDKDIISSIKDITNKYTSWFYSRKNNSRMENEELITSIAYLEYERMSSICKGSNSNMNNVLDIYQRKDKINFRIKEKNAISKVLNLISTNETERLNFLKSIKNVDSYLKNIKMILVESEVENLAEYLENELNAVFQIKDSSGARRTLQSFYALWYILKEINFEMIKTNRTQIKNQITAIFKFMKSVPNNLLESQTAIESFKNDIEGFWSNYKVKPRVIVLNEDEKKNLIKKQNFICPLCGEKLFSSDDIHIDHIKALAIGGRDAFLNLQASHKLCNLKKGTKDNIG